MKVRHLVSALIAVAMAGSIGFAGAQEKPTGLAPGPETETLPQLDPAVVQANVEKLQQQAVLANRLADKFQGDAAGLFGPSFNALDWKRDFGSRLMYQPVESLTAALNAPSLSVVQNDLFNATGRIVPKHASASNLSMHLLTPCRIVDTRFGGGGMLTGWRTWAASDTAAVIAAQGGNALGCGTFPNADAFLLYVTAVPPGAFGSGGANFITVQHDPAGGGVPTASTMNYYPGDNIANFAITLCNGCGGSSVGDFSVYASGTTDVIVDLLGWAGRSGQNALDCTSPTDVSSGLIAGGGGWGFINAPACPAGYARTAIQCYTSALTTVLTDVGNPSGDYCGMRNEGGSSAFVTARSRCCRTPIPSAVTGG